MLLLCTDNQAGIVCRQTDRQTHDTVHGAGMSRCKKERAKHLPYTATPFAVYTGTPVQWRTGAPAHRNTGTEEPKASSTYYVAALTYTRRAGGPQGRPRTGRDPGGRTQEHTAKGRGSTNVPEVDSIGLCLSGHFLSTFNFRPCQPARS